MPRLERGARPVETTAELPTGEAMAFQALLVFASADLLFLNKPRGMLVHGPDSLETMVREELAVRRAASLAFVPGPLHRLDRNTSGLVTFPNSAEGGRVFSKLIRERRVRKRYIALLRGRLSEKEDWTDLIERDRDRHVSEIRASGASARSWATPLTRSSGLTLALVEIGTGVTHQIRVQAGSRGFPLAGDSKYGGESFPGGYILHAQSLEFAEPPFPDLPRRIVAPLPTDAFERLARIFGCAETERALQEALEA
ncbi:MAG: RNA pseudouridine synthase [Spirochaetaceae bacterium]|nr:RNA pseudouridine synthase [Spirochaetaceae bacterium]